MASFEIIPKVPIDAKHNLHTDCVEQIKIMWAMLLKRSGPSLIRILCGMGLFAAGIASLALIFNPKGLLIPINDKPFFMLVIFSISTAIGFGAWLLSQYPLKMFLEPFLIATLWTFFVVLPILMLPLSIDMLSIILGFSLLLLVLVYGSFSKWREKRRKLTHSYSQQ